MANEKGLLDGTVETLISGMDGFLSSKTVVGNPVTIQDTIIIPLIDVSFGIGCGSFGGNGQEKGAGGMGGRMTPSSVLVIHDGTTRLINIATHTGMDKLLDLVPDFVDTFVSKKKAKGRSVSESNAREAAAEAVTDAVEDAMSGLE